MNLDNGRLICFWTILILVLAASICCFLVEEVPVKTSVGRKEVERALKRAIEFFSTQVSTSGGYHFRYASDLSYGRSESAQGLSQVTVQRQGTPIVGLAYLRAFEATGDSFYLDAARETALILVRGQHCSGGWDYIIELDPDKRQTYPYRVDGDCLSRSSSNRDSGRFNRQNATTLDDNVTQGALRLLMRVDWELQFQDPEIHEASLYALKSLTLAQYPNGAWPQRYHEFPDQGSFTVKRASYPESWPRTWPGPNYRHHYTLNDNAILDAIDVFLEAARIYSEPRYRAVAEKGGDFLLLAQMPDPQPAWAQQYDTDMHPVWGRIFEPPAVTGSESQAVLKMLLELYRETGQMKYLEPLPRAIDYLHRSNLQKNSPWFQEAMRECCPSDRCVSEEICLARFYELYTNQPLFVSKGSRVQVESGSSQLLDGYELSYTTEDTITHYGLWTNGDLLEKVESEYRNILSQDSFTIKRPKRLKGLSPWLGEPQEPSGAELADYVEGLLETMDKRGAWVEKGSVGKADKVISLFAAEDMVVTIGDKTLPLQEDQNLAVYRGGKSPLGSIISSETFARNIRILGSYLADVR